MPQQLYSWESTLVPIGTYLVEFVIMSADYKSNFYCEYSCGMRWNVQDVVMTLNIAMTSTPCMRCVMKMAVVSTIALRYCYSEGGDGFYGI
jgi:hypothetical protein